METRCPSAIRAFPTVGRPYAALDLGTNNCRLLIAAPGHWRLPRARQLSAGSSAWARVCSNPASSAPTGCSAPWWRSKPAPTVWPAAPATRIRAIATEACRRAANAPAFLSARLNARPGYAIRRHLPARGSRIGARKLRPAAAAARPPGALLFDIGGGSTELVWVRLDSMPPHPPSAARSACRSASWAWPSVSAPAAFTAGRVRGDGRRGHRPPRPHSSKIHCIRPGDWAGGRQPARHQRHRDDTRRYRAGAAMLPPPARRRPSADPQADALAAVDRLRDYGARLASPTHPCVGPERTEFTLPGCAIFTAIQRKWPVPTLTVADRGLREGLLLRLMRDAAGRPA